MKKIQLSDHFTASKILLFSLPSIGMQLVDNTYQVADGYFISNYIGPSAFAAENLIFPPLAVVAGVGMMFGSGGAALISHALGEENEAKANQRLTLTVASLIIAGVFLSFLLFLFMPMIAKAVGAPENLIPYCVEYGRILAVCMPFYMLNGAFHPLLITANQPGLGLLVSILNAAINIVLDWVAIAILGWGLKGAALATGLAWIISAMVPLYYFAKKSQALRFGPFRFDAKDLGQTCYNGSSEMADAISYALVAMLFNGQLLRYAGEAGVDAYAVSEYVGGIFLAIFFGISMSMTPVVGFHLGQGNKTELRSIRKNGTLAMGVLGIFMAMISYGFATPIAHIFVGYDQTLTGLSVEALRIIAFSYLLGGVTTFYSAFFTGMGDGTASLTVAVVKSFAFPVAGLLLLPLALGRIGIWLVTPLAEIFAMLTAVFFLLRYRKKQIL